MARTEFLRNVRTAASFVSPKTANGKGQSDAELERLRRGSSIWLVPEVVKGFDASATEWFPNFSQTNRKKLERSVLAFRDVAEQVSPNEPAKQGQVKTALPPMMDLLDLLKPYLDDPAIRANRTLIDAGPWPEGIIGFVCESRNDSEGEAALFAWVIVDETVREIERLEPNSNELSLRVMDVLRDLGRFVYVRFRASSESSIFYSSEDE